MEEQQVLNVGIIGCGLIGRKRAAALAPHRVVALHDSEAGAARDLATRTPGAVVHATPAELLSRPDIHAVIVATPHHVLAELTLAALDAGKHVLVEKPAAARPEELNAVIRRAASSGCVVRVGFNHRFHPALRKAKELWDAGVAGEPMMIRGRYGHGGRVGYEKEWRAQEAVSGGGEAVDQGVHLVDLARWFLGDFAEVSGYAPTLFWDMPVEDNAFMLLKNREGKPAWLHATWTEWKNLFSFEISGRIGKLHIEGLGGSYGEEKLTWYEMKPEMGPPRVETWEFPGPDVSWREEWQSFVVAIQGGESGQGATLADALAALTVAQQVRACR